MAVRK